MSNAARDSTLEVAVVGFALQRAQLLSAALERLAPSRFAFRIMSVSLDKVDPDLLSGAVTLAGPEGLEEGLPLLKAAQKLRTEKFYWGSLHLFARTPPQRVNTDQDWSIYFHRLPPEDVGEIAEKLLSVNPVSQQRREQLVSAGLSLLPQECASLLRALNPSVVIAEADMRSALSRARAALTLAPNDRNFSALQEQISRLELLPRINDQELNVLTLAVIASEKLARQAQSPKVLQTTLHALSNTLRAAKWQPEEAKQVAERSRALLVALQSRGLAVLPTHLRQAGSELCRSFISLIEPILAQSSSHNLAKQLEHLLSELHIFVRHLQLEEIADTNRLVDRIIVIEDAPQWRRLITDLLRGMALSTEIQEASTVVEAQHLLKDHSAALALVDLGLPHDPYAEVELDAGLSLIKQFSGSDSKGQRFPHRFIVLTAVENYTEVVREALSLGISPTCYLQKNPQTWEGELRAQVRLSLQPAATRLPRIEVFKRTGRIVRLEASQVKLDYPEWCLLDAFANGRKRAWCQVTDLARILASHPYCLDPESRSKRDEGKDTEASNPERRIARQIPQYISDLRIKLNEVYRQSRNEPPPMDIIEFQKDRGYRLNSDTLLVDQPGEKHLINPHPSVLIVEDDEHWGRAIEENLKQRGFEPQRARWVEEAIQILEDTSPGLISLDLELPASESEWLNGQSDVTNATNFLHLLHRYNPGISVAIFSAFAWRDSVMLEMLRAGVRVEDYIDKHSPESIARLGGSLARMWQESITQSRILDWDYISPLHPIEIDREAGLLTSVAGHLIQVSKKVQIILKILSESPNSFISRTYLIDAVYPDPDKWPENIDNALNQLVSELRNAIKRQTKGRIPGNQVICGERGVLGLRGVVQWK